MTGVEAASTRPETARALAARCFSSPSSVTAVSKRPRGWASSLTPPLWKLARVPSGWRPASCRQPPDPGRGRSSCRRVATRSRPSWGLVTRSPKPALSSVAGDAAPGIRSATPTRERTVGRPRPRADRPAPVIFHDKLRVFKTAASLLGRLAARRPLGRFIGEGGTPDGNVSERSRTAEKAACSHHR